MPAIAASIAVKRKLGGKFFANAAGLNEIGMRLQIGEPLGEQARTVEYQRSFNFGIADGPGLIGRKGHAGQTQEQNAEKKRFSSHGITFFLWIQAPCGTRL